MRGVAEAGWPSWVIGGQERQWDSVLVFVAVRGAKDTGSGTIVQSTRFTADRQCRVTHVSNLTTIETYLSRV